MYDNDIEHCFTPVLHQYLIFHYYQWTVSNRYCSYQSSLAYCFW